MNTTTLLLVVTLVAWVACAPRTKGFDVYRGYFAKRSPQYIKGLTVPGVKGNTRIPPRISLRKGEYMCGGKVCKLQPDEIPKGCDGTCQYRVN